MYLDAIFRVRRNAAHLWRSLDDLVDRVRFTRSLNQIARPDHSTIKFNYLYQEIIYYHYHS